MGTVRLLRYRGLSILKQLQIEEALLRATSDNWLLLNDGTSQPAIVMGISGKPGELVHQEAARNQGVQLIKRFSGGGTVVVDDNTLFATIIMQGRALPNIECYPRPIMQWSREFYGPVFSPYGDFHLQEHDYAFGQRKFGGNAQAITKQRWLHHTSLLWDFQDERMGLLKHPAKVPEYRAGRSHLEFVCRLKEFAKSRDSVLEAIKQRFEGLGFSIEDVQHAEAEMLLEREYLRSNKVIE